MDAEAQEINGGREDGGLKDRKEKTKKEHRL